MKTRHHIIRKLLLGVGCWALMAACSSDTVTDNEKPLPEGMGRIRITICTPEANPDLTRAVNTTTPWIDPDQEWEWLHTYRILICTASASQTGKYQVVQILEGTTLNGIESDSYPYRQSDDIITEIEEGSYTIFALANFADYSSYGVGSIIDPNATLRVANGYSEANIPMTGKLADPVTVNSGSTTDAGTITVWRVKAKMQFYFTNEATEKIEILGIEVDPINTNESDQGLIYLFSKDDLTSTANLSADNGVSLPSSGVTTGPVTYEVPSSEPSGSLTPLLTLNAKEDGSDPDTDNLFFYISETNATFTTYQNQYSLRFKIRRGGTVSELRYGVTTYYGNGSTGQDGFNVIRRNDWIHIPIHLTDWHYRIEPLPFVPIGGYPAATVSSDGLTATFSTGGMIALQPFIKKKDDASWRDFGDTDISYGDIVMDEDVVDKDASWAASIHWKNIDGTDKSGENCIVKTAFAYDPDSKSIIGELNNKESILHHNYMTTFTVHLKLKGPEIPESPGTYVWYDYTFTFNIILQ